MRSFFETRSQQLQQFLWITLLPAVPRLAWWVLGLAGFSGLNLFFLTELWPHYPQAENWFGFLLIGCLLLLPWLGGCTAQRVRPHLTHRGWRTLWQLVIFGAYGVAAMSTGLLCLGLLLGLLNRWW